MNYVLSHLLTLSKIKLKFLSCNLFLNSAAGKPLGPAHH